MAQDQATAEFTNTRSWKSIALTDLGVVVSQHVRDAIAAAQNRQQR